MTHAHVHRNERIRRVPKSMLPPRSSGPVAEGALPLFSRWHRSGNLLEPVDPGELVGSHPSGGSAAPGTRRRRGTAPCTWAGFREATEVRASLTRMTDGPIFSWETETAGQPYCRCKTVQFGLRKT